MATVELVRFRVALERTDVLPEARAAMLEDFAASRAKGANLPGIAALFAAIDELTSSEEGTPS